MNLYETLTFSTRPVGLDGFEWGRPAARLVEKRMQTDGAHDAGHLSRVFANARRITVGEREEQGRNIDWEIVAAAVLFHDVVNIPKDAEERERAAVESAEVAETFFADRKTFDTPRRELLRDAIVEHSYSRGDDPSSIESAVVQDADRLDALGAVGIARCFWVSGDMEGAVNHPGDPLARNRELDDTAFAIDHFFEKLLTLKDTFRTETGRELAAGRHEFVVDFLTQFAAETGADGSVPFSR